MEFLKRNIFDLKKSNIGRYANVTNITTHPYKHIYLITQIYFIPKLNKCPNADVPHCSLPILNTQKITDICSNRKSEVIGYYTINN